MASNNAGLSYEELIKFAKQMYNEGGDSVYECWDRVTYTAYIKEFGPITKSVALDIFRVYKGQEAEHSTEEEIYE